MLSTCNYSAEGERGKERSWTFWFLGNFLLLLFSFWNSSLGFSDSDPSRLTARDLRWDRSAINSMLRRNWFSWTSSYRSPRVGVYKVPGGGSNSRLILDVLRLLLNVV
jgi:hypothetical protein